MIHTYSLIHDDLPAMDDDELRRGQPTCHVAFGEDVAILAGDGLFAEALRLALAEQQGEPANVLAAVRELVTDGTEAHFMDTQTYEQMAVPEESVTESLKWVLPNEEVEVLYVDESPTDIQVPSAVELGVAETEPGLRGDTASGGGDKPATLESGVVVRVPLFVNVGDRVRVDTRSGEYVSRA